MQMSVEDVCAFLATLKLEKYAAAFTDNMVDGATLAEMDKDALATLGLNPVEQARVTGAVKKLAGMLRVCGCFLVCLLVCVFLISFLSVTRVVLRSVDKGSIAQCLGNSTGRVIPSSVFAGAYSRTDANTTCNQHCKAGPVFAAVSPNWADCYRTRGQFSACSRRRCTRNNDASAADSIGANPQRKGEDASLGTL